MGFEFQIADPGPKHIVFGSLCLIGCVINRSVRWIITNTSPCSKIYWVRSNCPIDYRVFIYMYVGR